MGTISRFRLHSGAYLCDSCLGPQQNICFSCKLAPPSHILCLCLYRAIKLKKRSYAVDKKNQVFIHKTFEKSSFKVSDQGLLIRGVAMISEPASKLLIKVLQFHYGK